MRDKMTKLSWICWVNIQSEMLKYIMGNDQVDHHPFWASPLIIVMICKGATDSRTGICCGYMNRYQTWSYTHPVEFSHIDCCNSHWTPAMVSSQILSETHRKYCYGSVSNSLIFPQILPLKSQNSNLFRDKYNWNVFESFPNKKEMSPSSLFPDKSSVSKLQPLKDLGTRPLSLFYPR